MSLIPKMPDEYKGEYTTGGGYTLNAPRVWTEKEIQWVCDMKKDGFNCKDIAYSVDRGVVSVSIKLKRLGKKSNNYNTKHRKEKYEYNRKFLDLIKPKTVLDLYCGDKKYYSDISNIKCTTNDKDRGIVADYSMDAFKLICYLYSVNKKYDLIDLDPYGSAYDCFDLAIKMAKKGLVITLGELGHKRFKRLDYVRRRYNINSLDEFTSEAIVSEIIKIGERNKKQLIPHYVPEWNRISRAYFEVRDLKITEQWGN